MGGCQVGTPAALREPHSSAVLLCHLSTLRHLPQVLVLEHPSPELPRVKVLLEQAMALLQRSAAAAAPPPAVAPAPAPAAATPHAAPPAAAAAARQPPASAPGSLAGACCGDLYGTTDAVHCPCCPAVQQRPMPKQLLPSWYCEVGKLAAGSRAGPTASPQVAQLLAQQLAMAFAQSQGPGQQPSGGWHDADAAVVLSPTVSGRWDHAVEGDR